MKSGPSRRFVQGLALAAFMVVSGAPLAVRAGQLVVVDDDSHASVASCDGAARAPRRIQRAVDLATSGATILVCPGLYQGPIRIGPGKDGLTIRSTVRWAAMIKGPRLDSEVIAIESARGVTVEGFNLVVRGLLEPFVSAAPPAGKAFCAIALAGIRIEGGASATIIGNRIDRAARCGYGWGILVRGGEATIASNVVRGFSLGGVAFFQALDGLKPTRGVVAGNRIRYDFGEFDPDDATPGDEPRGGDGIVSVGADSIEVVGNTILARAQDLSEGVPHLGAGIAVDPFTVDGQIAVRSNRISGTMTVGLFVGGSDIRTRRAMVMDNDVSGATAWGMIVLGVRRSSIVDNGVANSQIGLFVSDSRRNLFVDNDLRGNAGLDCVDDSAGDRTAGTANTWLDNLGEDADPPAICN